MGRIVITDRFYKRLFVLLALACSTLFYLPLGLRALWDPVEGRAAEIAREMLELKDWITPHLNYVVYFQKPPLTYWLTAFSLNVWGSHAFAVRFWSATFGLLTVCLTYRIGTHWKNERVGLLAGAILATSLGFFASTQFLVSDMAVTFWTTLTLLAGSNLLVERSSGRQPASRQARRQTYLLTIGLAGGVLTQGVVALVLPGVTLAAVYWGLERRPVLSKLPWKGAILLGLLLAVPWFISVRLRNPGFAYDYFIREHLPRHLTDAHLTSHPIYFYVLALLAGFMPWTVFLPKVIATWFSHHHMALKRDPVGAVWVAWTGWVVLFYSIFHSHGAGSLLPVFPALALLVAHEFDEALEGAEAPEVLDERPGGPLMPAWFGRGLAALILLLFVGLTIMKLPVDTYFADFPEWSALIQQGGWLALMLGFGVFILVGVWGMRQTLACIGAIVLVQVLLLTGAASIAPELDPYKSTRLIADRFASRAAPGETLVAYGVPYDESLQSLAFYLARRIPIYGPAGELSLGRERDAFAGSWFANEEVAQQAMLSMPSGTWGVTDADHWQTLRQSAPLTTFEMVTQSGNLLLFRKNR